MNKIVANNLSKMLAHGGPNCLIGSIGFLSESPSGRTFLKDCETGQTVSKNEHFALENVNFLYNPRNGAILEQRYDTVGSKGTFAVQFHRITSEGRFGRLEDHYYHRIDGIDFGDEKERTTYSAKENLEESVRIFNELMEEIPKDDGGIINV